MTSYDNKIFNMLIPENRTIRGDNVVEKPNFKKKLKWNLDFVVKVKLSLSEKNLFIFELSTSLKLIR